ncbi:MAG: N-acetyl sugar amidotransferase [Thermodesulfobacteriota bacterium]
MLENQKPAEVREQPAPYVPPFEEPGRPVNLNVDPRHPEKWRRAVTARLAKVTRRCARCLHDDVVPGIAFGQDGVCNFCRLHDQLDRQYPPGEEGARILAGLADEIRREGRRKKYDVVVGVSGGCDSSYMIHLARELGLRPLAAHFDNTWNSTIAVENIHNMLKKLDVDLYTYVVDNEEYDDLYRSFFKAGVPDLDNATDIGLATTLYMAAEKYGIKYIFEGHSFRTEGVSPLGWMYMDAKYIESVQKEYGTARLRSFPNLWFWSQMKWMVLRRIKKIRPLYYVDYRKAEAKRFLERTYGWQWYGGHHLENRITNFVHTYFFPRRFGADQRLNGYSALVRSGQMSREEGLAKLAEPPKVDFEIVELVKKRLGFTSDEFEELMELPVKTYRDFKTYKKLFERLRPLFWVLARNDLIPRSFYLKYTAKQSPALSGRTG